MADRQTPNIAAAGDALMASLAPTLPSPLEAELSDKLSAARRLCESLKMENERLRASRLRLRVAMAQASAQPQKQIARWLTRALEFDAEECPPGARDPLRALLAVRDAWRVSPDWAADIDDPTWNPDAHIEVTLTVADIRAALAATAPKEEAP